MITSQSRKATRSFTHFLTFLNPPTQSYSSLKTLKPVPLRCSTMGSIPNETLHVSSTPSTLHVSVIGGGIGGLCTAIGLLKHHHIDVQLYEAAPSFGEIGAGVAIGPNAIRALQLIGAAPLSAFKKQATQNMWQSHANVFIQARLVSCRSLPFLVLLRHLESGCLMTVVTRVRASVKAK